jgi:hypothetical protein
MTNATTKNSKTKTIHVFVNRSKLEITDAELTGAGLLAAAGFEGQEWDLLELNGEGDPTGGEVILADRTLKLKNGMHFRVIPGNRTFGA